MEVDRQFGWDAERERPDEIDEQGVDPEHVLLLARGAYPSFNPTAPPFLELQWQGQQGACQGHALAHAFQLALVQKYSFQALFSRACGYYRAQEFDGIRGDRGSTLAGGQKVANSGMCLERDWPYPSRYDPRAGRPPESDLGFTMPGSKVIKDPDLAYALIEAGCAIQTGVAWGPTFEKAVCDRYSPGRTAGGHSTLLYGLDGSGRIIHHNSWRGWQGDGRNVWTRDFLAGAMTRDTWSVFVCYESTNLNVPESLFN